MDFYHFANTVRAFLGTFQAFLEPLMKLVEGYFCLMVFIVVYMKISVLLSILTVLANSKEELDKEGKGLLS
jgi:hypothetical protein